MTKDETKKLLMGIQAVFPTFDVSALLLGVWASVLEYWPYETARAAVMAYLGEPVQFPPRPGDINERCIKLTKALDGRPPAAAAFADVCKCASQSMGETQVQETFADNPSALAAIRQVGYQRIRYANLETELTWLKKDFERHYNDHSEHEVKQERLALLPPLSVKQLPSQVHKLLEAKL
jgi:hypothetical protein